MWIYHRSAHFKFIPSTHRHTHAHAFSYHLRNMNHRVKSGYCQTLHSPLHPTPHHATFPPLPPPPPPPQEVFNPSSPPVSMAQFSVLPLSPGVDLSLGRQGQAVLASRVDGHLLDEHVLDGLQQGGGAHGLRASDTQATPRAVACAIHLPQNTNTQPCGTLNWRQCCVCQMT